MPPLPLHCRYIPVTDSSGAVRGVLLAANKVGAEGFVPVDEAAAKSAAAFVGAVLARCARRLNDPSDVAVLHIQELQVRGGGVEHLLRCPCTLSLLPATMSHTHTCKLSTRGPEGVALDASPCPCSLFDAWLEPGHPHVCTQPLSWLKLPFSL